MPAQHRAGMSIDPRIDAYIAARADFARPILAHLRARVHATCPDVVETIKWGMPSFSYRGRPLASMAAFKSHAAFGFWDRQALATGREGDGMGQYGRIATRADLPPDEAIETGIREAMALIDAGARPTRARPVIRPEAQIPPALAAALARYPGAEAIFRDRFAPSHRREYCEWVAAAKREETRERRAEQAAQWIHNGKQRNWKYESR